MDEPQRACNSDQHEFRNSLPPTLTDVDASRMVNTKIVRPYHQFAVTVRPIPARDETFIESPKADAPGPLLGAGKRLKLKDVHDLIVNAKTAGICKFPFFQNPAILIKDLYSIVLIVTDKYAVAGVDPDIMDKGKFTRPASL